MVVFIICKRTLSTVIFGGEMETSIIYGILINTNKGFGSSIRGF